MSNDAGAREAGPIAVSGRQPQQRHLQDYAGPLAVLLLLYAGYFKASPLLSWIPVDLTFLGAALTLVGIATVLVTNSVLPRGTLVVLALWATFAPASVHHANNTYGSTKTEHLFILTLIATLGPLFLIRSELRQVVWVYIQIAFGIAFALGAYLYPSQSTNAIYRLSLDGSNAVASGRAAGVAVVGCFVLALAGHRGRAWLILFGAAVTVPLFLSGSRGPVLAAAVAVAVVAAFAPASGTRRFVRVGLVAAGGVLIYLYVRGDTTGGVGRISSTLLAGNTQDTSSQARFTLWRDVRWYISNHFWGTGWGGLHDVSGFSLLGRDGLIYPHNVFLEVTGEAGWIAGIATLLFLWFGLRHLRAAATSPYAAALFGMAVFSVVNAMVSGDVNDNRMMWASVAFGWAILGRLGTAAPNLRPNPLQNPYTRARFRSRKTETFRRVVRSLPQGQGGVREAGFIILIGSGLGYGISILLTPFITRVFQPAVYGSFALITAVTSVFVGVSTFRLEVQAQRVTDDAEASGLIRLGFVASCAWAVVLTLAACLAVALWNVNGFWLSIGFLVFIASLQLLGSAVLTRARSYRNLGIANFVQGASVCIVQLCLGLVSADVGSLIAGFGASRLGWLPTLRQPRQKMPRLGALWKGNRRFAAVAGSSAFINSLTSQLPILLTSIIYGDVTVGQLAIAIRILVSPLSIVAQAASAANIGEVGRLLRLGDKTAAQVVRRGMRDLFVVGLIPCGMAAALSVWVVPFILGKNWQEAGQLLAVLAAGTLAQFVAAPFAALLSMTGNNPTLLKWDTSRCVATILSLCIPWALGLSVLWAIGSYSVAFVVIYSALAWLTIRAVATCPANTRNQLQVNIL